jgi:pheromone shutdown protein TraB
MITLVGVGHVFAISDQVRDLILSRRPEVVCLELDPARYSALMDRHRDRRGRVPLQYLLLAQIQKRMADKFESEAGAEMLAAARAASEVGARVALIDMDAAMVFGRLWRAMPFREKLHLMFGAMVGLVASKETVEKEMDKYESHEVEYIETLGSEFPSVKRVLIDERNIHMARRIADIAGRHEHVLAVVGDGHMQGLLEELGPENVEAIRLKDLRRAGQQPLASDGQFGFSYYLRG